MHHYALIMHVGQQKKYYPGSVILKKGFIATVIIDGKTIVEAGSIPQTNLQELSIKANMVNQRWKERTGYKYPPSFQSLD